MKNTRVIDDFLQNKKSKNEHLKILPYGEKITFLIGESTILAIKVNNKVFINNNTKECLKAKRSLIHASEGLYSRYKLKGMNLSSEYLTEKIPLVAEWLSLMFTLEVMYVDILSKKMPKKFRTLLLYCDYACSSLFIYTTSFNLSKSLTNLINRRQDVLFNFNDLADKLKQSTISRVTVCPYTSELCV